MAQRDKNQKAKSGGTRKAGASGAGKGKKVQDPYLDEDIPAFLQAEVTIILSFAAAVLLFLSNFHLCGVVGDLLREVQLGIFGMIGYIFPFLLFIGTTFYMSNRGNRKAAVKLAAVTAVSLTLCGLAQMLFGLELMEGESLLSFYQSSSQNGSGGGLIGGLLSYGLRSVVGSIGAYLVFLAVLIICGVCITERSVVSAVKNRSDKAYRYAKEDAIRRRAEREERQEERRRLREEKVVRGVDFGSITIGQSQQPPENGIDALAEKLSRPGEGKQEPVRGRGKKQAQADAPVPARTGGRDGLQGSGGLQSGDDLQSAVGQELLQTWTQESGMASQREEMSSADVFTGRIEYPPEYEEPVPFEEDKPQEVLHSFKKKTTVKRSGPLYADREIRTLEEMDVLPVPELPGEDQEIFPEPSATGLFVLEPSGAEPFVPEPSGAEPFVPEPSGTGLFVPEPSGAEPFVPEPSGAERSVPESPVPGRPASGGAVSREAADAASLASGASLSVSELSAAPGDEELLSGDRVPSWEAAKTAPGGDGQTGEGQRLFADQAAAKGRSQELLPEEEMLDEDWADDEFLDEDWTGDLPAGDGGVAAGLREQEGTDDGASLFVPEGEKRVVTASGKVIETETQLLQKKLEKKRQEAVDGRAKDAVYAAAKAKEPEVKKKYIFPPTTLLKKGDRNAASFSEQTYKDTAIKLQQTLRDFGVGVTVTNISCGPSVTRYELHPEQGVKVSKIVGLADDIKLSLAAEEIRIEAPIPGRSAVGIEVPNKETSMVYLRDLLEADSFRNSASRLTFAVGKDIAGQPVMADIAKMPHLLIAGATGSGKSVCINTLIMSIIFKADPEDVKLIMVDPKVVELSVYNGIPHLLIPVVTDPKKASGALNWAVAEMEDRYRRFAEYNVRNLQGYNEKIKLVQGLPQGEGPKKMPQIVIIIDELADLMMVVPGEVEDAICRLAQLARAAGIHLVIATQRPSVNVITGLIKANIPSRIAFAVSSGVDSRTIIDMNGAEKLLGKGDMLFFPSGIPKPQRVQGAFISDQEVSQVVDFLTEQGLTAVYNPEVADRVMTTATASVGGDSSRDGYFAQAGKFIIEKEKASIGMLQRVFKIGFNRAARIMDQLAEAGVVGEEEGTKPRKVLMTMEEFEAFMAGSDR